MKASRTHPARRGLVAALLLFLLTSAGSPVLSQAAAVPAPPRTPDAAWPDPISVTLPGLQNPNGLAVNHFTNRLYITSRNNNSVLMVDATTLTQLARTTVGSLPFGVAVNIDTNKVYVANFSSGTVSVLRGSDLQLLKTINLSAGSQPTYVGVFPGMNMIAVALHGGNTFAWIDGEIDEVVNYLPLGVGGWGVAVDDEYEIIFMSFRDSGNVWAYDLMYWLLPAHGIVYPCGPRPNGTPYGLAFDGAKRLLHVACGHGQHQVDTAVTYHVSTTGSLTEVGRTALDPGGENGGGGVAVNPSTGHVFITNSLSGTVSMIGANSWRLANFPLGQDPFAAAVDQYTGRVYVGDRAGNRLYAFYDWPSGVTNCPRIMLSAPHLSDAGQYPAAVATGDFNNDGKLDAAVSNGTGLTGANGAVSMLLGNGAGGFSSPHATLVDRSPVYLAAADFNADHKLDLAVANYDSSNYLHPAYVSVLLGNGDGSFGAAVNYEVGYGPDWIAVGDFNGDNAPDLAVTNAGVGNIVSVLLNDGAGAFQPAASYWSGTHPTSVVTADFNGDGKLDLVTSNWGPSNDDGWLTLLYGNGDGTFTFARNLEPNYKPQGLITGDFNDDSKADLIVGDSFYGSASVLLGQGDGTFTGVGTVPGAPAARADFNGDGRPDLAGTLGGAIDLWLGLGNGAFRQVGPFAAGGAPGDLAAGDFNGDGRPDLAVKVDIDASTSRLSVLLHQCERTICLPMIVR